MWRQKFHRLTAVLMKQLQLHGAGALAVASGALPAGRRQHAQVLLPALVWSPCVR